MCKITFISCQSITDRMTYAPTTLCGGLYMSMYKAQWVDKQAELVLLKPDQLASIEGESTLE